MAHLSKLQSAQLIKKLSANLDGKSQEASPVACRGGGERGDGPGHPRQGASKE